VNEFIDGHDTLIATDLQNKMQAAEAAARSSQEEKDASLAAQAEAERLEAEKTAAEQLERDTAMALQFQSSQDELLARQMAEQLQKEEDEARATQLRADEELARKEGAEFLDREAQIKADEELATKMEAPIHPLLREDPANQVLRKEGKVVQIDDGSTRIFDSPGGKSAGRCDAAVRSQNWRCVQKPAPAAPISNSMKVVDLSWISESVDHSVNALFQPDNKNTGAGVMVPGPGPLGMAGAKRTVQAEAA